MLYATRLFDMTYWLKKKHFFFFFKEKENNNKKKLKRGCGSPTRSSGIKGGDLVNGGRVGD